MSKTKVRTPTKPRVHKDPNEFHQHYNYVQTYRRNVMATISAVRNGVIDEIELDKLQNFCQMSLKMMEKTSLLQLRSIWRDTEIMGLVHPDDAETAVVLDPSKQPILFDEKLDPLSSKQK